MSDKKKILVIDDEESIRTMIKDFLSRDYAIMEAYDGLSGLSMLETLEGEKKKLPDLIICDLLMPTLTGSEFVIELKKKAPFKNIPVIVITASHQISLNNNTLLSCDDILTKPFSMRELRDVVNKKLGNP